MEDTSFGSNIVFTSGSGADLMTMAANNGNRQQYNELNHRQNQLSFEESSGFFPSGTTSVLFDNTILIDPVQRQRQQNTMESFLLKFFVLISFSGAERTKRMKRAELYLTAFVCKNSCKKWQKSSSFCINFYFPLCSRDTVSKLRFIQNSIDQSCGIIA